MSDEGGGGDAGSASTWDLGRACEEDKRRAGRQVWAKRRRRGLGMEDDGDGMIVYPMAAAVAGDGR